MLKPFYLVLVVLSVACLFWACENDMAEVQRVISQEEQAIERARDVEILYSDSAVVRVKIQAYTMLNYLDKKEPKREFPQGFVVDFFNENQRVTSHLSANYAMQYMNERKIFMQDSVVIWNKAGERLEAEDLTWDEQEERVYSDDFVKIRTEEQVIYGYGFTSNLEFTRWKIKDIRGEISADELMGE